MSMNTNSPLIKRNPNILILLAGICTSSLSYAAAENEDVITVTGEGNSVEEAIGSNGTYAVKSSATATKTSTPLIKTPQSISVITEEELQTRRPDSIKNALNQTPGIMTGNNGSSSLFDSVMIRGFNDVSQNIYLDGLKLQGDMYADSKVDPYFLQRIEALRGPASVLYGKSNPGGVIAAISKRPQRQPLHEVQLQAGNHHEWKTQFDFSDAIDDEQTLAYRLVGNYFTSHSQQNGEREKRYAIAPSLLWQPSERTSILFQLSMQNEPRTGYYGWLPRIGTLTSGAFGKLSPSFNEGEASYNRFSRQQRMVGYQLDHALNDNWSLHQAVRYQHTKINWRSIYGNGLCTPWSCKGIAQQYLDTTLSRAAIANDETLHGLVSDTRLEGKLNAGAWRHTLLLGIDYSQLRNDIQNKMGTAAPLNLLMPQYGNQSVNYFSDTHTLNKNHQSGVYLQDQAEWKNWIFTLGGRFDHSVVKSRSDSNITRESTSTRTSDDEFTWRSGINYVSENGLSPYFSYSESFEPNSGVTRTGNVFKPSSGKQYEAGIKFIPDNRPISASIAAFQLTKSNNLRRDAINPNYNVQEGKIRSRGIEIEGKAALTYNLNMLASYTYTDTEFRDNTEHNGKTPAMVPKHMASLWADYTVNQGVMNGLSIGAGSRYISSTPGDDENSFKVPSHAVFDSAIKYQINDLPGLESAEIALNVNNLFNKHYVSSCFTGNTCSWGAERQILTTLTLHW
ncbi:ferrichrome porin FhuA [Serratia marcescens]|uniref:Ferrichrome porin FhuA n=1 Tax=Serratia marcescens TaxID=615 RepID=A0A1Q4NTY1_SERMA|nr:ferrichrome porin FhuA [Serratia marcescens]OKB64333.1 ferrichrome porin FhuA [Serratia marcescens]